MRTAKRQDVVTNTSLTTELTLGFSIAGQVAFTPLADLAQAGEGVVGLTRSLPFAPVADLAQAAEGTVDAPHGNEAGTRSGHIACKRAWTRVCVSG